MKTVVDEAVAKYGRLDVYFANAGVLGTHDIVTETAVESFERTLRVNVVRCVSVLSREGKMRRLTKIVCFSPSSMLRRR